MSAITCVIPTLDSASTLEATLLGLREQPGLELLKVIVVDSGSDDDTLAICRRWNVETRFEPPGNLYRAVNAGLAGAATPWVTYVNADDVHYAGALSRMIAAGGAADFIYGDLDFVDRSGLFLYSMTMPGPESLMPLLRCGILGLSPPGTIYRRSAFEAIGGFDPDHLLASDRDLILRALKAGLRFAHLPQPVCAIRLHGGQLTEVRRGEMQAEMARVTASAGTVSAADRAALARWRLRNAPNYMQRFFAAGSLRTPRFGGG